MEPGEHGFRAQLVSMPLPEWIFGYGETAFPFPSSLEQESGGLS